MKRHTRESWLLALTGKLQSDFERIGHKLPKRLRVSCGWPLGKALSDNKGKRAIGQCFPPGWSKDKHTEIFISPFIAKGPEVAAVLVHELCHAAVGCEHGHKGPFKQAAAHIGLEGKMKETVPGKALQTRLNALCKAVGPYPHTTLDGTKLKKQGTRMIKLECAACGYVVRTSQKWIDQGIPSCYCGDTFNVADTDQT